MEELEVISERITQQDTTCEIINGDCVAAMREMEENSVDSIVTDPPYGLKFMGKEWDYDVPGVEIWRECLRVLKPGGHLLSFAGTRTQHRMCVNIEDAGFEIRDMIAWVFGSGFPKSSNISKHLDKREQNKWLNVCKALDSLDRCSILEAWKEYSKIVSNAGLLFFTTNVRDGKAMQGVSIVRVYAPIRGFLDQGDKNTLSDSNNVNSVGKQFQRNKIGIGMNTQKNDFVQGGVHLEASLTNNDLNVVFAELGLREACHTSREPCTVLRDADVSKSQNPVKFAEGKQQNDQARFVHIGTVQCAVKELLNEKITDKLKAVEALKIWLGKKKSSEKQLTSALCAALTEDLKRIILSQSKTFQNLDTTSQMECVSVISVTITESTAEHLILNMVDILRKKAIDKAAGAERKVIGKYVPPDGKERSAKRSATVAMGKPNDQDWNTPITKPATEGAQKWQGFGTALKPALEPITLARKPLSEKTIAANVLKWGTGAINIDGCKVGNEEVRAKKNQGHRQGFTKGFTGCGDSKHKGRWPANFIHDGSQMVLDLFPESKVSGTAALGKKIKHRGGLTSCYGQDSPCETSDPSDKGSAARFFYCAKASKAERNAGLQSDGVVTDHGATPRDCEDADWKAVNGNHHPTVKPIKLMRYLVRLVTPPGGVVLDAFMGSGTTGLACGKEGFNFIGMEEDAEYFRIAHARIAGMSK